MKIPVDKIYPNPEQPRKTFDLEELQGLADSMRETGQIMPVAVEECAGGYILHDGERRLRAARLIGWAEIEAVVSPPLNGSGARDRLVRAMTANLQRADLNPIEEGQAFLALRKQELSNLTIAHALGLKNPNLISQRIRLLDLDTEIQELVAGGRLYRDVKLADALLDIPDGELRVKTARRLASTGMALSGMVQACRRVAAAAIAGQAFNGTPAIAMAAKKTTVPPLRWDALRQAGCVPSWKHVEQAVREVCESCALRSMASPETCRSCPAVEFLVRLCHE